MRDKNPHIGSTITAPVISIQPRFAKAIYAGEKRWEFRKVPPKSFQSFFVYESSPVSKITGHVKFSTKITGTANNVYYIARQNGAYDDVDKLGLDLDELTKYADGDSVTALRIMDYSKISNLELVGRPPQNFGTCKLRIIPVEGGEA